MATTSMIATTMMTGIMTMGTAMRTATRNTSPIGITSGIETTTANCVSGTGDITVTCLGDWRGATDFLPDWRGSLWCEEF